MIAQKRPISILVLPGDGVGPEVSVAAIKVLKLVAKKVRVSIEIEYGLAGGACYDVHGLFLQDEVMHRARNVDAIIFGAEGGPKWDSLELDMTPIERSALSRLRVELDLYANIRPVKLLPELISQTPFRHDIVAGADMIILRELTSGVYFGKPRGIGFHDGDEIAIDTQKYSKLEIQRIAREALDIAQTREHRLVSIDKANVMETGVLWRRTVSAIAQAEYPDVHVQHLYADAFLCDLVTNPTRYDVVLADNLFGDLVSDAAAPIAGSLGMLPSASLGMRDANGNRPALYEPVHGSAPDIAGMNLANPCAAILSVAMLFDMTLGLPDISRHIENAVRSAIIETGGTRDIGGLASTTGLTDVIIQHLARQDWASMEV